MPPGYPYNIDPNYGPVPMVTDDGKIAVAQPMIKEERLKESPSPNENPKNQSQVKLTVNRHALLPTENAQTTEEIQTD